MKERFKSYLDKKFASYKQSKALNDFKEELLTNLLESYGEFIAQGLTENESFSRSIETLGDYGEALRDIEKNTPKPAILAYVKFILMASFLYFVVLLTTFFVVSFATRAWKYTWIIPAAGVTLYSVLLFVLNSKNAFAKNFNGRVRFNFLMLSIVLTVAAYFSATLATGAWELSWLTYVVGAALWFSVDTVLVKAKRKKPVRLRMSFVIMGWTTVIYLMVSELIGGDIWIFSWLILLGGTAVLLGYYSWYHYSRYKKEIS